MPVLRLWRRLNPKKLSPESEPVSDRTYSTKSGSRGLLQRIDPRLLICSAPSTQDPCNRPSDSSEEQGTVDARKSAPGPNHHTPHIPLDAAYGALTISVFHPLTHLSVSFFPLHTSNKDII